jgi:SnoaL-like polyketide cyclase
VSVDHGELWTGWREAWSGRDPAAFAEVCAPAIHYEDPLTDQPAEGIDELGDHARQLWTAFPDVRLVGAGEPVGDEQRSAGPARLLGTNRGALGSLPATDRFLSVHVLFYGELERGRLMRVRAFLDLYDAAVQLNVLPKRGTLGARALLAIRGFGLRG